MRKADTDRSSRPDGNMSTAMRPALLGRALVLRRRMRASYAPELGRKEPDHEDRWSRIHRSHKLLSAILGRCI
jgi:hypothetical protein